MPFPFDRGGLEQAKATARELKQEHAASGSRDQSLDALASIFGGRWKGGDVLLYFGRTALQKLVKKARVLYNSQNSHHLGRQVKKQPALVSVSDASRELLIALGLVDGPRKEIGLGPLSAPPTLLLNGEDDGTGGGDATGGRAHEQRPRVTRLESATIERPNSEFLLLYQFTEYA